MFGETRPRARASWALAGLLVLLPFSASASVLHVVDSLDNLYYTDWGHPYNVLPFDDTNNQFGAIGRGDPAQAVSTDFAAFAEVEIEATGSNGINNTSAFGPDGLSGSFFRALTVYSLIGVWSTSSSAIVPIGSSFFIGDSATLIVPSTPSAFLWLGFNDGIFHDNPPGPGFSVTLTGVPEPSTFALLALAFALLRKKQ